MKNFHFPITLENASEFTHPNPDHFYGQPFKVGDDVGVCNGWVAIRVRSFLEVDHEDAHAAERFENLPWHFFDQQINEDHWGMLDDRRGGLWRPGELSIWSEARGKYKLRTLRRIGIGSYGPIVTQPVLQLISKLPRVKVYTEALSDEEPLYFTFNGGEGIAHSVPSDHPPSYRIFKKSEDLL